MVAEYYDTDHNICQYPHMCDTKEMTCDIKDRLQPAFHSILS